MNQENQIQISKRKLTKKQRAALTYLSKGYAPRRISEILEMRRSLLEKWIADDEIFKERLKKANCEFANKDSEFRKKNNTTYLEKIYHKIHQKIDGEDNELDLLEIKDLFTMSKLVASEIRADTPSKISESPQKPGVNIQIILSQVKERAKEATSFIDVETEEISSNENKALKAEN